MGEGFSLKNKVGKLKLLMIHAKCKVAKDEVALKRDLIFSFASVLCT